MKGREVMPSSDARRVAELVAVLADLLQRLDVCEEEAAPVGDATAERDRARAVLNRATADLDAARELLARLDGVVRKDERR